MTHLWVKMLALKENIWVISVKGAHLLQQTITVQALILYEITINYHKTFNYSVLNKVIVF